MQAQVRTATISGNITDSNHAVLPGARIKLEPGGASVVSDNQGKFTLTNVAAGTYSITVSYVGFAPSSTSVTVVAGQPATTDVVMNVSSAAQQVVVTAARAHGEAEAINEERTSENILNVLPANVIVSLPNANIADAVGRLPGVTLERDEGEGKYVQIRGTEPRLSNLTIDGIEVPSPEGGVRQVKLDTIPADLVDSVQINKTLLANQPADAIGGSVNLVTKTAGDHPTLDFFGSGGFTPIDNTVPVDEFSGTVGNRFGGNKQWGGILGGSYDYNGRGIDDVEPVPTILPGTDFTPGYSSIDLRDYIYDRTRYGFGGALDRKLGAGSDISLKGLYSEFKDYGHRYDYTLNDNSPFLNSDGSPILDNNGNPTNTLTPVLTTERRLGDFQVAFLVASGVHTFTNSFINWTASVSRSRMLNPINGGESINTFNSTLATSNCQYNPALNTSKYRPQFSAACYAEAYNPSQYNLTSIADAAHGKAAQLNLEGDISGTHNYHLGSHFSSFQLGFRIRNAHKFDDSYEIDYTPVVDPVTMLQVNPVNMAQFVNGFKNTDYYSGSYPYGPGISWEATNAYRRANPGNFDVSATAPPSGGGNSNNFNLVELVTAGYLMDSIELGRLQLIGGLRIEATNYRTLSYDNVAGAFTLKGSNSYISPLPSVSAEYRLTNDSDMRFVYGRRISRPDPQFLTAATNLDQSTVPPTLTIGNPALKPEHGDNFDVLYEHYLTPLGAFHAGFFYKRLTSPIVQVSALGQNIPPYGLVTLSQAQNAGSAYIAGVEVDFEQHFTYLPGLLSGIGLSANYSYATSQAKNVNPGNRTDSPALLRQAPNTFNISPTYDRGPLSLRVGMAYNGANIFSYQYADGNAGGVKGPGGDNYLYSHYQVDAQASYGLGKGFSAVVSGLNLNNAVFGFYYGSPQFVVQREYYKPTYSFGLRWTSSSE